MKYFFKILTRFFLSMELTKMFDKHYNVIWKNKQVYTVEEKNCEGGKYKQFKTCYNTILNR